MPLTVSLAAPGSRYRFLAHRLRVSSADALHYFLQNTSAPVLRYPSTCSPHSLYHQTTKAPLRILSTPESCVQAGRVVYVPLRSSHERCYSTKGDCQLDTIPNTVTEFPETAIDSFATILGIGEEAFADTNEGVMKEPHRGKDYRKPLERSRNARKASRKSRPALILDETSGPSHNNLYAQTPLNKVDLSYTRSGPRGFKRSQRKYTKDVASPNAAFAAATGREMEPLSLYSIAMRYIQAMTAPGWDSDFKFTDQELALLNVKGHSPKSIERWASSLTTRSSVSAAEIFQPGNPIPPWFVVSLFLRRRSIQQTALSLLMHHIDLRLQLDEISLNTLKIIIVRLLRHARIVWPESIPWIASVFTTEATRIYEGAQTKGPLSAAMQSDLTSFCNTFLTLLSLPASLQPVISALHQQNAQFQVLRFMANRDPAFIVTRAGFRATARNQLAHTKTSQEREWAKLKGPLWPPWMQEHTAMDEGKDYEFGASRASRIMHRMYEAGYGGKRFEELAEMYAGWDIDLSPTIQTRTSLPSLTVPSTRKRLEQLLWAGRIRTTRTAREAWACFLAYEASGTPPSEHVYQAMFEKLQSDEAELSQTHSRAAANDLAIDVEGKLLPGDMKEVLAEPKSSVELIFIAEPVPTYEQLYRRMKQHQVRPTGRCLAFLIDTAPDFGTALEILDAAKDEFGGGVQSLSDASILQNTARNELPNYFITTFIRFLCRFGYFSGIPQLDPIRPSAEEHEYSFKLDRYYLLQYAYAILMHLRPHDRPAWTVYMEAILFYRWNVKKSAYRNQNKNMIQYRIICELLDRMQEEDLSIDERQFQLVCTSAFHVATTAVRGNLPTEQIEDVMLTTQRHIRTLFHSLVSANTDPNTQYNTIPVHVPGPAVLHIYVRALGTLRDYEGIFSFITWATSHTAEVTSRATAQHNGLQLLRRTIIAIRAGLEGHFEDAQGERATDELVSLVRDQIESVQEWGGWATDEEIELYIRRRSIG